LQNNGTKKRKYVLALQQQATQYTPKGESCPQIVQTTLSYLE